MAVKTPGPSKAYVPPNLALRLTRLLLGIASFLFLFYTVGHYLTGWPFPTPLDLLRIAAAVLVGGGVGLVFARFWPLPPEPGFERIFRIFFLLLPALVLGYGLQILLSANQALSLIVPLSAWLASGLIVRLPQEGQKSPPEARK
ncbi:hypothetical protein DV704_10895 [Meiothermus sp. QL-1]|uniref:hypothetical protein n=1 Tax=Meiothermus sp. QL-1 TaxID=2058095 RepID=UPI000E0ABB2E|nr:hypothetical protein [Meiothermus sp. QL-1]RDI94641.1 hypothetical protein DV704_10895 [Meiothermus sp. QL-1]